ncbi:MAG TPA: LLM class flavin-dependent oxidoreductase [Gaiellaceae bacterium]|nr:LLM class flavin-dependent oxidoreductase [Gaiellaceae bacterium]
MRFGLQLCTLGAFADPRETVRVARAAEAAGWEALLVWDHLRWAASGDASADPWVTLGACAAVTERMLLGTAVTPLPRRRPQMLAQELATLSLATGGRVVLGAGIGGSAREFEAFGEEGGERVRAAKLDEGLGVLRALLDGGRVDHDGEHYRVRGVALAPLPVRPIPFWIGGNSPRALHRAARWDGWLANSSDQTRNTMTPDEVAAKTAGLGIRDVCVIGYSQQADLAAYAAAGVTWWLENVWGEPADVLHRVELGPPALP